MRSCWMIRYRLPNTPERLMFQSSSPSGKACGMSFSSSPTRCPKGSNHWQTWEGLFVTRLDCHSDSNCSFPLLFTSHRQKKRERIMQVGIDNATSITNTQTIDKKKEQESA